MILERTFSVSELIVMIIALHLLLTFFRKIHFLTGKKWIRNEPISLRKMAPFVIVFLPCLLGLWSQVSNGLDLKSNRRSRFGMNTLPDNNKIKVSVAVVMPHSMFKQREYKKIIMQSALELDGSVFEDTFDLSPYLEMVQAIPSPTEVLGKICDQVCKGQVCIISKIYRFA